MEFIFIFPFIMFFSIFTIVAASMSKHHKQSKETMQSMVEDITKKREEMNNNSSFITDEKTCEYCGTKVPASSSKCGGCGATIKKK